MIVISEQMLKREIDHSNTHYLEQMYKNISHDPPIEKLSLRGSVLRYSDPTEPVGVEEVTSSNLEVSTTNEVMSHFQVSLERNYRLGELLAK